MTGFSRKLNLLALATMILLALHMLAPQPLGLDLLDPNRPLKNFSQYLRDAGYEAYVEDGAVVVYIQGLGPPSPYLFDEFLKIFDSETYPSSWFVLTNTPPGTLNRIAYEPVNDSLFSVFAAAGGENIKTGKLGEKKVVYAECGKSVETMYRLAALAESAGHHFVLRIRVRDGYASA